MQGITFLGGGNMATSLLGGLLAQHYRPEQLRVVERNPQRRQWLEQTYRVQTAEQAHGLVQPEDTLVIAVKPKDAPSLLAELAPLLTEQNLLMSVAAGVSCQQINAWLGKPTAAIVRVMPNTPSLVNAGVAGLYATVQVTPAQRELAQAIMQAVGIVIWTEQESLLDAVIAVSGSGPAYGFLLMEVMEQVAVEMGLAPESARLMVLQTLFGAAKMALASEHSPAELRRQVMSPGGTTERAVQLLQHHQFEQTVRLAMQGARQRAEEMSAQWDQ